MVPVLLDLVLSMEVNVYVVKKEKFPEVVVLVFLVLLVTSQTLIKVPVLNALKEPSHPTESPAYLAYKEPFQLDWEPLSVSNAHLDLHQTEAELVAWRAKLDSVRLKVERA